MNFIFLIPIIFVVFENIISIILYGFPWINFSLIVSNIEIFLIISKYFGSFVISFFVLLLYCLPVIIFEKVDKKSFIVFILILILPISFLLFKEIFNSEDFVQNNKNIKVEVIQLNKNINETTHNSSQFFNKIIDMISKSNAELLIFGENNISLITDEKIDKIKINLKENQNVVIGGTRIFENKYFNSLVNISKYQVKYFDKKILVPFGEFIPFRNLLNFFEPIAGQNDYSIGTKERLISLNSSLSYIPIICYEVIFYWKLLNSQNHHSNFIINITNDIWFGKYIGPYQHLYLTKLRAAEFSKSIIRVSNNGVSAIINERGEIISNTKLNEENNFVYDTNILNKKNYYYYHNIFNIYFFIILILLTIYNFLRVNAER